MKQAILIIALVVNSAFLYSQVKTSTPKPMNAKSDMVLRSNTRDQVSTFKNNTHHVQQLKRRQVTVNRQKMVNKKRMQQFHQQKMINQQRNMQRRVRQQSIRQQPRSGR